MERILLYYPAINIPTGQWLLNSILYTDKVSSILPFEFDDKRIIDDMKYLYDNGEYQPTIVYKVLEGNWGKLSEKITQFENTFINTIESDKFRQIQNLSKKNVNIDHRDYELYLIKLTRNVLDYLHRNNFVSSIGDHEIKIDRNVAIVYMSMLAEFLAETNENIVTLSTDAPEYENIAFQLGDSEIKTNRILLKNCLPTPAPNISIKEIIKFKKQRRQELLRFRLEISKIEKEIVSANNDNEKKLKMIEFQEKYKIEITDLVKLYGDSKLDIVWNTFSSLLDFKEKDLSGLAKIVGTGLISSSILTGIPGIIAGGLILTWTGVSSYRKIKRNIDSNSFSYLYYAQKEGILEKV
jgi:hypothetical protein